jgi:splicing factor 1
MGQENEEQAELIATIQHDHSKMKQWYNTAPEAKSTLHTKYGATYPSFWRDVVPWNGWKESRKLFLKSMELKEKKERDRNNATAASIGTGSSSTIASTAPVSMTSGDNGGTTAEPAPRKRRSRWGNSSANNTAGNTNMNTNNNEIQQPTKRRSRWGGRGRDETPRPLSTNSQSTSVLDILPGLPTNLNSQQSQKLKELQKILREANEKLENLDMKAAKVDALPNGHPDRSPSPPPVYGVDGKRKNTRAVRWRERYTNQRQDTLEEILSLTSSNLHATSAIAPSLFKRKRTRKIHIPVEKHPTYNFIGLIIGPRGKTQKDMENKTGCKIAIRGKGSVKEGARGRRDGKMMEGDAEPLHVVITGDNQANVDAAADMVTQMLVVIDDDKNVHKQQQLRELALLNGTLKEDEYCPICGEKGHRAFECPKRFSMNKETVSVKCAICGDTSHVTSDCKLYKKDGTVEGAGANGQQNEKELDSDYLAFMNELDGKPAGDTAATASSAAADRKELASLVTTIEKTVGGVVTVSTPASTANIVKREVAPVVPLPPDGGSLITTISSRIVKSAVPDSVETATTTATATAALSNNHIESGTTQQSALSHTPTITAPMTSMPTGLGAAAVPPPPPPSTSAMLPPVVAPPPAVLGVTTALPPPPSSVPPPPPNNYYGHQQQQQPQPPAMGSYYPQQYPQHQQHPYPNAYNQYQGSQGNHPNYGQHHHQQQQQNQSQVAGWDYTNYYGSGQSGGDADGASGLNWWEN